MFVTPKSDFWIEPEVHRDSGNFFFTKLSGDFSIQVTFSGDYKILYDQAGIMVRKNNKLWMKCGVELYQQTQQASTVMTRDFSDWSIQNVNYPKSFTVRVIRKKESVDVEYSLNEKDFVLMRRGYLTGEKELDVGVMACAPTSEKGFKVVFHNLVIKKI